MNKNIALKWVLNEMRDKIIIEEEIIDASKPIIGIYGIFVSEGEEERCAYIGRSNNIYLRMFDGDSSHMVKLKQGIGENTEINAALKNSNAKIKVKILKRVEYDFENYNIDMQKLASSENYYIDYYQSLGQCLEQRPDGKNWDYADWEAHKNK